MTDMLDLPSAKQRSANGGVNMTLVADYALRSDQLVVSL